MVTFPTLCPRISWKILSGCRIHTSQTALPTDKSWVGAAEDSVLMFDVDLVDLVANLVPKLHTVKTYIVLTDRGNMHRAVKPL